MLEIQDCVMSGSRSDEWAKHLRLLHVLGASIDKLPIGNIDQHFNILYLSEQEDHPNESNYLSVSYCWTSNSSS